MNTITKAARRAARDVCGGSRDLSRQARLAHRANRAACRRACKAARLDSDTTYRDGHCVDARNIS